MDYGKLLHRAWIIIKENPYLLLLGVIVALTTGSPGSTSSYNFSGDEVEQYFGGSGLDQIEAWMGVAMAAAVGLICLGFIVFLVVWLLQQVARGGLISGVETIENGEASSLGDAWRAGWHRKWTLVGIGLVMMIPVVILIAMLVGGLFIGLFVGFGSALASGDWRAPAVLFSGAMFGFMGLLCLIVPVAFFIGLWGEFAYRAAMLEGSGVWDSYRRGWHVLFDNIGPVLVIVAIRIGIGIVLFLPMVISSICCLLWPILLVLQGAATTYFSSVWTLAWREFTGASPNDPSEEALEPVQ